MNCTDGENASLYAVSTFGVPGSLAPFSTSWPSRAAWTSEDLVPLQVFYEFDGPLLYSVAAGPFTLLMMKFDELEGSDLYTASIVDHVILAALDDCRLSVFGAISHDMRFMVEMNGMIPVRVWDCRVGNMSEARLPKRGVALSPYVGSTPDLL
jgi:hypothetical protein